MLNVKLFYLLMSILYYEPKLINITFNMLFLKPI